MPSTIELHGYPHHVSYALEKEITQQVSLVPHIQGVKVSICNSTVKNARTSAPEPFVRLVADKKSRAALIKILTRLKQNIQVIDQAQWIPKS
jgi:phosphomannomutase